MNDKEGTKAKPKVTVILGVPRVYEIGANAVVVIWHKGEKTYKMLYSYATPIAFARFGGFGSLERIYAVKTTNHKARSNTTMKHYRQFLDWIQVDKTANKIENLEQVEVI